MNDFKKLNVWKESMDLVEEIYNITDSFPNEEKFGLVNQMRRSSISIPSNIAEGAGRNSDGEFKQFLGIAIGSLNELLTQIILAKRIGYMNEDKHVEFEAKIRHINNILYRLKLSLDNDKK